MDRPHQFPGMGAGSGCPGAERGKKKAPECRIRAMGHNSAKRSSRIGGAYRMVSAKFGQDYADELFIHNPAEILKQKQKHEATD